jgi:membrane-bound serine protease (ClpP class)
VIASDSQRSFQIRSVIGKVLTLFLMIVWSVAATPAPNVSGQSNQPSIADIRIDGEITPAMASFLENALAKANREGADGVLIEIRTLGGRVDSAIQMRDAIIGSVCPVAIFIGERAISAGALIAIAADKIIMAPGSHLGAAEPVPNEPKALAYVSGEFRTTAERRGRDPVVAMAMVDASIEIAGLVGPGEILDMTAAEAYEIGFADYLAAGRDEAFQVMGWTQAQIVEVKPDFRYRIAQFLTRYEVASILLILGMLCLVAEFFIPGFGAAGIVGIACFILYFAGGFLAGHTELWSVLIFIAGIILLVIEISAPGFGLFGILGIAALFAGVVFAAPTLSQGIGTLLIAVAAVLVAIPVFFKVFGRTRFMQRLVLAAAETAELGYTHAARKDDLLGKTGRTQTVLRPSGSILIDGRRIDALADGEFIDKGVAVQVVRLEGSKVFVSILDEQQLT